VAHEINRKAIAENLVGPASEVIHPACPPDQFGCTQDVPRYDHDPAKTKALLAEAGYPNGFEFDIHGCGVIGLRSESERICSQLSAGMRLRIMHPPAVQKADSGPVAAGRGILVQIPQTHERVGEALGCALTHSMPASLEISDKLKSRGPSPDCPRRMASGTSRPFSTELT